MTVQGHSPSAILSAVPLLGLCLAACNDQGAAPHKPRVTLIMTSLVNEFFMTTQDGTSAYTAAHPAHQSSPRSSSHAP
mgnify:FL=1